MLGIDGPIFDPTDNVDAFKSRVGLRGVLPALAEHRGRFVVLLRPVAQGDLGPAAAAGAVPIRVYVNSAAHKCCDIIDPVGTGVEECRLGTAAGGAEILWREQGLLPDESDIVGTIVWAIIRLGTVTSEPPRPLFYNAASTTAPPYALMAVVGTQELPNGQIVPRVDQPSAVFRHYYIVNAEAEVQRGDVGAYQDAEVVEVAYDGGTPTAGSSWGPRPGQWTAAAGYPETCLSLGPVDAEHGTMLARLHPVEWLVCELSTPLEPSSPGTAAEALAAVCYRSPAGTFAKILPEMQVTVVDRFSSWRGWPMTTKNIASRCVAAFPNRDDKWTLVTKEPATLMLSAIVANDTQYQLPIQLTSHHVIQPIGALIDEYPGQAANIFSQDLHQGDTVLVLWNQETKTWGAFGPSAGGSGGGADEKVKTTAFDLATGFLADKVLGASPWIETSVSGGAGAPQKVNIGHTGPGETYTSGDPIVDFVITSDTGGPIIRLRSHALAFDQKGHNTTGGAYTNHDIPLPALQQSPGSQGPQGSPGPQADAGLQGPRVFTGDTRPSGPTDSPGMQGSSGSPGL